MSSQFVAGFACCTLKNQHIIRKIFEDNAIKSVQTISMFIYFACLHGTHTKRDKITL